MFMEKEKAMWSSERKDQLGSHQILNINFLMKLMVISKMALVMNLASAKLRIFSKQKCLLLKPVELEACQLLMRMWLMKD